MNGPLAATAAAAVLAAGAFGVHRALAPSAPPSPREMTVTADDRTIYGKPWDGAEGGVGIPGLPGFGMLSTASPPDMALCVVDLKGAECQFKDDAAGKPQSLAHDHLEARFPVRIPTDAPVGIIVYDIDGTLPHYLDPDDLIDVAIIAPAGADTTRIEAAVREMTEQLAPTSWTFRAGQAGERRFSLSNNERKRREGPIPILTPGSCEVQACRLQQSSLLLR